jgi:ketosteroid isomerase-like protein
LVEFKDATNLCSSAQGSTLSASELGGSPADDLKKLTAYFVELEQKWADATVRGDTATVDSMLADNFVETLEDGTIFTTQAREHAYQSGQRHWDSAVIDEVKVQLYGDTAIVTGRWTGHGTMNGKVMAAANRFTDTWVRLNDSWKCVASHQSPVIATSQPPTTADAARETEREIERVQDALIAAYIHWDTAALDRILADEYTFINDDAGGVVDKKQVLDSFKAGGDRQITSYTRQDDNVRLYGYVAVLTYRYHSAETFKGRENGGDFRVTRIFVKRD